MKRGHVPGSGKVHIAHRSRYCSSRIGRIILITSALLTWTALVAHARGPAFLVKDINTTESGYPTCLTSFDGNVFFTVDDIHAGPGLWRSDGTPEGTVRIKAGSHGCLTATDDALFWVLGSELRKSDGTDAGTVPLLKLEPGFVMIEMTAVKATLFFVVINSSDLDAELWQSDGTVAGTVPLIHFPTLLPRPELPASKLTAADGTLFFSADDGNGFGLWKSDGTAAGTVRLTNFASTDPPFNFGPEQLTDVDGRLFFTHPLPGGLGLQELWRSDGTVSGTERIAVYDSYLDEMTDVNGTLFFTHPLPGAPDRQGLWRSDGTAAGTMRFADIPGTRVWGLTNADGTLYFVASSDDGTALWRSDGTQAGTRMVRRVAIEEFPVSAGGQLYFRAGDASAGSELWRSDGTETGTVRVKDIRPGPAGSMPFYRFGYGTEVSGTLFFVADDGSTGQEIWKTDGTEAGTARVADLLHDTFGSSLNHLTDVNGMLLFRATDGNTGYELWRSDGTRSGTRLVKDINPGDASSEGVLPGQVERVHDMFFFAADDGSSGNELWRSDGTESGTVLVEDINPGPSGSDPFHLTEAGGTLLFWADDGSHGLELWKSDGTPDGTVLVRDINPGPVGSAMLVFLVCGGFGGSEAMCPEPTDVNGTLFFAADDGSTGLELWKTDGTAEGTMRVADIAESGLGFPTQLTSVNGALFFTVSGGLWWSDGTAAGTMRVTDIPASQLTDVNGTLFFVAGGEAPGLWRSDGTAADTVPVREFGPDLAGISDLTNFAGTLVFVGSDASKVTALWRSDGTEAGTVPLKQLPQGPRVSALTNIDDLLLFTVGEEIWQSDGTEAGTGPIQDLGPGPALPSGFTRVGGCVFFSADAGGTGAELWALDTNSAETTGAFGSSCDLRSTGDAVSVVFDSNPVIDSVGETAVVDISAIGSIPSLDSVSLSFTYSSDVVDVESVSAGTLMRGCSVLANVLSDSPLIISSYCGKGPDPWGGQSVQALGGPGTLFSVTFRAISKGISPLNFSTYANILDGCLLNDGTLACAPINAQIAVRTNSCRGDCSADGRVTISDLITAVNIALGRIPLSACQSLDTDDGGTLTVDELVAAVNEVLHGCT